jgi:hypothetical protein
MNTIIEQLAELKLATVATAILGAALAVLLEFRRHTWVTALLALFSGAFVAVIATDPVLMFFNWPREYGDAVAAVLGISGRNLIVWVLSISKDPLALWRKK